MNLAPLAILLLAELAPAAPDTAPDATKALHALFPCTPGLAITYEVEARPARAGEVLRFTDIVRGPGKQPGLCVLERVTTRAGREVRESFARELLADRVLHAGWTDQPLALRPPLVKLPLEVKRRWTFNTSRYELEAVDAPIEVPAGRFAGAVIVRERSVDGTFEARSVYVPGVGLVLYEAPSTIQRAVKVERPAAPKRPRPRG